MLKRTLNLNCIWAMLSLLMTTNVGLAQIIIGPPSEVYHPERLHTFMGGNLTADDVLLLPFLADTIANVQMVDDTLIYAGDIVLGKYSDVINPAISIYYNHLDSFFLWHCNTIPYTMTGFSLSEQETILQAVKYVNRKTHTYWKPKTTEACYVQFVKRIGSYSSPIGCHCNNNVLSHVIELDGPPLFGKIVHEMSHTLGLYHEQQRNDRDTYVDINMPYIMVFYKGNFIKQKNTTTYLSPLSAPDSDYDYCSIMHYNRYSFSVKPPISGIASPPLETISLLSPPAGAGEKIGQRTHYTDSDTAKINVLYPNGIEWTGPGRYDYQMVYKIGGVLTSSPIVYSLLDANFGQLVPPIIVNDSTNTPFTISTLPCDAAILKVEVVGGCIFYEDLF